MSYSSAKYGHRHRVRRRACLEANLRENGGMCRYCGIREATVADHSPPLAAYADPSDWEGEYVASCAKCSHAQGGRLSGGRTRRPRERSTRKWI